MNKLGTIILTITLIICLVSIVIYEDDSRRTMEMDNLTEEWRKISPREFYRNLTLGEINKSIVIYQMTEEK